MRLDNWGDFKLNFYLKYSLVSLRHMQFMRQTISIHEESPLPLIANKASGLFY